MNELRGNKEELAQEQVTKERTHLKISRKNSLEITEWILSSPVLTDSLWSLTQKWRNKAKTKQKNQNAKKELNQNNNNNNNHNNKTKTFPAAPPSLM